MISISKEEAKALRENIPGINIVRTVKQKSNRGHYYCEESRRASRFLDRLRNQPASNQRAGVNNR